MFSFGGNDLRLGRILYKLLPSLDENLRFSILKKAYDSGKAVSLMGREIVIFGQQHGKYGSDSVSDSSFITLDQLKILEEITLDKIRNSANEGSLKIDQNIARTLYNWKEWSGNQEPEEWLKKLVSDNPKSILLIINAFISNSYSHGMSDRVAKKHSKVSLKGIANFMDLSFFSQEISKLKQESLTEEESDLVKMFQADYLKYIDSNQGKEAK